MSIEAIEEEKIFILDTKHSTYMIKADDTGCLRHLYYGPSVPDKDLTFLQAGCDRGFSGNPYEKKLDRGYSFDTIFSILPDPSIKRSLTAEVPRSTPA